MKIFSNFDTKLRQTKFEEYKKEYWVNNVLCFGRSKLYRWLKIFLPFLLLLIVSIFLLIFFYRWLGSSYFAAIVIVVLILDFVIAIPVIGKFLDYISDFIIVIPSCIMMYDQSGFFKRNVATISSQSIKMISIKKNTFLYSVFDNWDIVVLTEWDVHDDGEILFRWVARPEKRRNEITRVVGIDTQANQNPQ